MRIYIEHDKYIAWFRVKKLRKFKEKEKKRFNNCLIGMIGNVGVALDLIPILEKLGHKVTVIDVTPEEQE
jgi:hypothetical protein